MNNSTLGGLIKDYRTQKGISQLDIAFALGWKEPSRLSRIEQGRTEKPTREIIDKIIAAIGLSEEEKNVLLFTGGYLPTEEEILKIREKTDKTLKEWLYPACLMDFSWRLIDGNRQIGELFLLSPEMEQDLYKSKVRVLDLLFSQKMQHDQPIAQKYVFPFLKETIMEFKYEHKQRTKEKWYIEHIKRLMENDLFRKLWSESIVDTETNVVLGKYAVKHFINPKDSKKILRFHLFVVPVLQDPRFSLELHVPMDIETYNYYL